MRTILKAACLAVALPASALAQTPDMNCADYLKVDQQMTAQLTPEAKAALKADPQAAALDAKLREYCQKNPKASVAEAAQKALMP